MTVSAYSATSATATGNLPTTGNLTSFLDRDLASFKRRCTRDACQRAFNTSWHHLSVLGRVWACIHRGRVFTTDAASCFTGRKLSNPTSGCGICVSGGSYPYADRKHCFHRMILAYNELYRPHFDACIILNCQDAPILYREGLFSFAYTGSPFSYEVPFPDYSSWQSYPQWLQGLQHSPPPRWHMKLRRAVLVGGQTRASSLRKKLFGGFCDKAFHQLGFVDMVGVDSPFIWPKQREQSHRCCQRRARRGSRRSECNRPSTVPLHTEGWAVSVSDDRVVRRPLPMARPFEVRAAVQIARRAAGRSC